MPLLARKTKPSDNMIKGATRHRDGPLAGMTTVQVKKRDVKGARVAGWKPVREATPEEADADTNPAAAEALKVALSEWADEVIAGTVSDVERALENRALTQHEADALLTAEQARDEDKPEGRGGVIEAIFDAMPAV